MVQVRLLGKVTIGVLAIVAGLVVGLVGLRSAKGESTPFPHRVGDGGIALPAQPEVLFELGGEQDEIHIIRDFKDRVAWLTMDYTTTWHVDTNEGEGQLTLVSLPPEDVGQLYGQPTTHTWGSMYFDLAVDDPLTELGGPEGVTVTTSLVEVGGLPAVRTDYEDAAGRGSSALAFTLTNAVQVVNWSEVSGAPGAPADAMRQHLDNMLNSIHVIHDYVSDAIWTTTKVWSSGPASLPVVTGYAAAHPVGWTATGAGGSVQVVSPASDPYTRGVCSVTVGIASPVGAGFWDAATEVPFKFLGHETRRLRVDQMALIGLSGASSAYLVRVRNGATLVVALANPAVDQPGTSLFWLYTQHLWGVAERSGVAYPDYGYP